MTNIVQLQEDITHALLSAETLLPVNIIQWRKMRMESDIALETIWQTPRAGRSGAGIIVEMPEFVVDKPNLAGPQAAILLPIAVLEEPNLNMSPATGTNLSAEEIAQYILEALHGVRFNGSVGFTLFAAPQAIQPADEFPGVLAYRVRLAVTFPREQRNRVDMPAILVDTLTVTLSCGTADAVIHYTLDSTFPGPSNPSALIYEGPFTVDSGTLVRAAGYKTELSGSFVNAQTIT